MFYIQGNRQFSCNGISEPSALGHSQRLRVAFSRLRSSNRLAQGSETVLIGTAVTTMQTMSQPVGSLCPPPDVALESFCQATLCLSASWPIISPISKQNSSSPWFLPRGTLKQASDVRTFESNWFTQRCTDTKKKFTMSRLSAAMTVCLLWVCQVCSMFAQNLVKVYTIID